VPRLLVDLTRQRAPLRVLTEVRQGRNRGANPRLDDLLGEFADLFVGGDKGLDGGFMTLGEKPAQDLVLVDDGFGGPSRIGLVKGSGQLLSVDNSGFHGIDQWREAGVARRPRG